MNLQGKAASLCLAMGFAGAASPAQWSMESAFSLGADIDTNRRLVEPATTSHAAKFSGNVELSRATETYRLSLRPRFELRRFDGSDVVLNSNDGGLDLRFQRSGERTAFGISAMAAEDSTLTSELADTGIVEGRARRRTLSGGADGSITLGERSKLEIGASYLDVDFDEAAGTGLTPYRYPATFAGLQFDTTGRSRFGLTASAGRLEIPATGDHTDNFTVRASWNVSLTERFSLELNAGKSRTESDFSSDDGAVYGMSGTWTVPRSSLSFALSRDVQPSALGRMVAADSLGANWRWFATERLSLTLGLRHLRREDLLYGVLPERRDYSAAHAALSWRMDENWNLELRGGGSRQAFESTGFDAQGERVSLAISWSPRRYALAR